ncbi:cyclophilin-like protein, partial [Fistulina hepatica ATCC 64428]
NFRKLCTGEAGMCRNAPKKRLWYKGNRIHRIVQGYIAQGGDVTKGDGMGGDSIYGGKFADEPAGLARRPKMGTLAMANAGPNTNTSQFFVVLTDAPAQLERIVGKYVIFGEVVDGWDVLRRLDRNGTHDGFPMQATWVGDCG